MAECINKAALTDKLAEDLERMRILIKEPHLFAQGYVCAMETVMSFPAADAVKVVRCADCRYSGEPETPDRYRKHKDMLKCKCQAAPSCWRSVMPDGYCSCGAPKEDK